MQVDLGLDHPQGILDTEPTYLRLSSGKAYLVSQELLPPQLLHFLQFLNIQDPLFLPYLVP